MLKNETEKGKWVGVLVMIALKNTSWVAFSFGRTRGPLATSAAVTLLIRVLSRVSARAGSSRHSLTFLSEQGFHKFYGMWSSLLIPFADCAD